MTLEEVVKQQGFESEAEFHKLVGSVDLSSPEAVLLFKRWQNEDGSKVGLVGLLPYCGESGLA
jgi:hypothetical protein